VHEIEVDVILEIPKRRLEKLVENFGIIYTCAVTWDMFNFKYRESYF